MLDRELDDLTILLPPLLQSLEALGFISRYLDPQQVAEVVESVGRPDDVVRETLPRLAGWSEPLAALRGALTQAAQETLAAYDELRGLLDQGGDMGAIYRALRHVPRAQETLFPLASGLKPVSRFFLEPELRGDDELLTRLAQAPQREDTGLAHVGDAPGARGGFSIYVPETYTPDVAWPLVMALHGGAGTGRGFLWSWLREARGRGAILIAPTATGETWALQGPDTDSPNLARILAFARDRWNVDPDRLLLTGMSDGGTFSYVSGLEAGSPFTHLAPASAAFHPMLVETADPERLAGLPIHIAHGALDWMFPVGMAREAAQFLAASGAVVTYRELPDLSHAYPRELNPQILAWLNRA
ncbi:hypothetical protein [Phenylobacterium sp.]|uniref:carboxylesterase family protein n=1 Tax=Phenylobacterium sp. TaxID=1871053 RepID=UPI0035B4CA6F